MALCKIDYDSEVMQQKMGVCVIIPENKWGYSLADRPADYRYPTLWLLCGGGFDHTDWLRYTAVELYAAKHGIAIVLPGISYAGYVNTAGGTRLPTSCPNTFGRFSRCRTSGRIILWRASPWAAMARLSSRCSGLRCLPPAAISPGPLPSFPEPP